MRLVRLCVRDSQEEELEKDSDQDRAEQITTEKAKGLHGEIASTVDRAAQLPDGLGCVRNLGDSGSGAASRRCVIGSYSRIDRRGIASSSVIA